MGPRAGAGGDGRGNARRRARRCGSGGSGAVERERKRERKGGPIRKTGLGANNHGAELGARIYGTKLSAKSPPRLRRAQVLGTKVYGAETCKLGATKDGAELRVQILKSYLQGHICEIFSKKGLKIKKLVNCHAHKFLVDDIHLTIFLI